jgi:ribosomal protein S24E
MDLNITKKEEQPLLSRTEIIAEITFGGETPSRYDIVQAISKQLKSNPEFTLVKHIYNEFGSQKANIEAYIYKDEKVMKVLEKKIREVKEPKKQEEKPEPKKEQPKEKQEEKSEDKKQEEKEQDTEQKQEKPEEKSQEESKEKPESKKE